MRIALIGAGRLAAHLALALQAIGRAPVALGARDMARAAPLAQQLGLPVSEPAEALRAADWVFLCVRDDAIAPLAAGLPWEGQLALHTSGATSLEALKPAERRAGFHPLQLLADPMPSQEAALAAFQQARVGIEAQPSDFAALSLLARALGAVPLALAGAERARYHAAANLSASALFAPLHAAAKLWAKALGQSEQEAWLALQPLAQGALQMAVERGLADALSGPMARGDAEVLSRHLQALDGDTAPLYRELMQALLPLAESSGRLDAQQLQALRQVLRRVTQP
jgi:predicted short-subunit dehydrogenase-like oxidoreductase (DUF2520 family)